MAITGKIPVVVFVNLLRTVREAGPYQVSRTYHRRDRRPRLSVLREDQAPALRIACGRKTFFLKSF